MAKKYDKLAQEVAQALACNMSYGKWKAKQPVAKVEEKPIPEGWRKCEYCGEIFRNKNGKRFCDIYCRTEAYKPRANEIKLKYIRKYRQKEGMA